MKLFLIPVFCCLQLFADAQDIFSGRINDGISNLPLEGVTVSLRISGKRTVSDDRGAFSFSSVSDNDSVVASAVGFRTFVESVSQLKKSGALIRLYASPVILSEVKVSAGAAEQYRSISGLDVKMRGINNSQEVLRMIPGLFIGQHAGGGKAEQIFLRGFDLDHGTDINITVDGIPVNMVSHAHGQGYADLHFVIPELIDHVSFKKGTYYPEKGNFTTTGFVDFQTLNALTASSLKVEGGMYNTARVVGQLDLTSEKAKIQGRSGYLASEYMYTKGYFDNPQNFNRINLTGKYFANLSKHNTLSLGGTYFTSKWNASGQIPDRAVESGLVGFYGAIDPNEGGRTSRANGNLILTSTLNDGSYFKNQLYYSRYHFLLYSNFTFYKEDPVNGDQIRQKEARNLYGYNGSYHRINYLGKTQFKTEAGINIRMDRTSHTELSRTKDRTITTAPLMLGDINENNLAAYVSEVINFSPKLSMLTGIRYDYFEDAYLNRLIGNMRGSATASIVSPKLSFFYSPGADIQLYLSSGKGFHSNDTRVVVAQRGLEILPAAYGSDLGIVFKPVKNLLVNAAAWYLYLQQEFVYVGDEGVVEPSGRSRRMGGDLSVRYQPLSWLYADLDLNYSHGRAIEEPKGENYLPLAPVFTSIGGLTARLKSGWGASLRYRYMADRPANEDYSTVAKGYFITDAFINYAKSKYEFGLSIQNLFNTRWKETQFDTESRLYNEPQPVTEIHFTPGTPFFAKISITRYFGKK